MSKGTKEEEKMKKILLVMFCVLMSASVVFAIGSTTTTVGVSASVPSICGSAVAGVMTMAVDPPATAAKSFAVSTPATVKCTNGQTISIDAASQNSANTSNTGVLVGTLLNGTNSITYEFTFSPSIVGAGFGSGGNVSLGIGGSIAVNDAQNALYSASNYTDTVTLTINY